MPCASSQLPSAGSARRPGHLRGVAGRWPDHPGIRIDECGRHCSLKAMVLGDAGQRPAGQGPRMCGRPPARGNSTMASGWAPCSSPRETPGDSWGGNSEPCPSTRSQWSGSLARDSHSVAPEMKSAITASTENAGGTSGDQDAGLGRLARKLAFRCRGRAISASKASAVVTSCRPSSRCRQPASACRASGRPDATSKSRDGWRTSNSLRPSSFATSATAGTSRPCCAGRRLMSILRRSQRADHGPPCQTWPIRRRGWRRPMISVFAPFATASSRVRSGRPTSAWPTRQPQLADAPVRAANRRRRRAVFAASWSGASPRKKADRGAGIEQRTPSRRRSLDRI